MANRDGNQQPGPSRPLSPTSHPLEDPLSLVSAIGGAGEKDDDQDVPSSFQSQGTLRGMATLRANKASSSSSSQPRPGYFDLQRLAAQTDVSNNAQSSTTNSDDTKANTTIRGPSKSRSASIYSVNSYTSETGRKSVSSTHSRRKRRSTAGTNDDASSIHSETEGEGDDELPEWLNRVRHRSPAPMTFQPRPITQVLDFSTHTHSDTASTPSVIDDSGDANVPANDSRTNNEQQEGDIESQLTKALQELEKWKKAYEDLLTRHARELNSVKKAHEAREAALLEILTSSGISKSRAERALTHATAQSQVPVFRADERVADSILRTKSPIIQQSAPATQTLNCMTRSTSSEERELPASIMEAMLDEFHSGISTPITAPNARSSNHSESRSNSPAPSARSSMNRFMQPNATTSATSTTKSAPAVVNSNVSGPSSLNGFFTLNWRRKKPSPQLANGQAQKGSGTVKPTKHARESSTLSPPTTDATATLTNALDKNRRRSKAREPNVTRLPSLFGQDGTGKDQQSVTQELEPILAHDFRPPTLTMAARRRNGPKPQPFEKIKSDEPQASSAKSSHSDNEYQSSGDEFEVYGGKHLSPEELAQRVASTIQRQREAGAEDTMLTDQYGFVYDATPTDIRLLRRARKEESHAPACLTGIRVGVRARGGTDSQSEDEKVVGEADSDSEISGPEAKKDEEDTQTKPEKSVEAEMLSSLATSVLPTPDHLKAEKSLDIAPSPSSNGPGFLDVTSSKPVVSASSLTAASQATSGNGPTSPEEERLHFLGDGKNEGTNDTEHTIGSGRGTVKRKANASITVRRLLTQLQEMHSKRQDEQQAEWDAFLKKRKVLLQQSSKDKMVGGASNRESSMTSKAVDAVRKGGDAFGFASSVNDITPAPNGESNETRKSTHPLKRAKGEEEWSLGGLIGLSQLGSNTKDQQEFQKLIQGGIPLIYRPKLWYECSGAFDRVEPGRYQELLNEHESEENACTKQIDLDVGRTMPTNIFFAGDGPGVAKLRRLLVAYSWYNPQCGYCQGMNNLAATLLLTHATEEEAFWVLASLIENILPMDYFTAHLLIAQADQRVLMDFVQELMPKLAKHIDELGVDLPAVTFAWFLSLYTDCLPVETLFRVWDVLFVEGMAILFKVALSIFMINERELLQTNSPSSFYSLMHSMTSHQFSADKLLTLACEGLRSSVKMEKIEERRAKHIQDLQIELGLDVMENNNGQRTPSGSSIQL